jgi:hypothetical protein
MKTGIEIIKLPSGWYADLTNENKVCIGIGSKTNAEWLKIRYLINYVNSFELVVINENNFEFRGEFWYNRFPMNRFAVDEKLSERQKVNMKKKYEK